MLLPRSIIVAAHRVPREIDEFTARPMFSPKLTTRRFTGLAMLLGRFAIMVPVLALAGTLAAKKIVPAGEGTFQTDTPLFVGLLIGVILIVGGLTFFPAVSLGPVVEQLLHGKLY